MQNECIFFKKPIFLNNCLTFKKNYVIIFFNNWQGREKYPENRDFERAVYGVSTVILTQVKQHPRAGGRTQNVFMHFVIRTVRFAARQSALKRVIFITNLGGTAEAVFRPIWD